MPTTLQFSRKRTLANQPILAVVSALLLSTACSKGSETRTLSEGPVQGMTTSKMLAPVAGKILVATFTGAPIANATITIGPRANVPFPGNVVKTDAQGLAALPAAWTDAQPVTVDAANFVRATWMAQKPMALALTLRSRPSTQKFELKGKATGFTNLAKDGWVDVGVIFPALRRDQLATLQVTDLVSAEMDTISVMGQTISIPSNISLPKQEERYFFTITLDKPVFRNYVREPGTWKMVTTHARFPFEDVVDDLRGGKSFFDVLNYFEFKSASITNIPLTAPSTAKDLPITGVTFNGRIDVAAPRFASTYTMLAVSVADDGGMLYPTDVKKLGPGETRRLVMPQGGSGLLLGALRESNAPPTGPEADGLSAIITANNRTTRFEFLDLPKAPKIRSGNLILDPPAAVAAVTPVATYATLNKVDKVASGQSEIEIKSPVWDVYAGGWNQSLDLPDMTTRLTGTHRWEVLFGGAPNGTSVQLGPKLMEDLTHIAKSAVDL